MDAITRLMVATTVTYLRVATKGFTAAVNVLNAPRNSSLVTIPTEIGGQVSSSIEATLPPELAQRDHLVLQVINVSSM